MFLVMFLHSWVDIETRVCDGVAKDASRRIRGVSQDKTFTTREAAEAAIEKFKNGKGKIHRELTTTGKDALRAENRPWDIRLGVAARSWVKRMY